MSEFDPRWPSSGRDEPGRSGQDEAGQGRPGSQPYEGYPGYFGRPGADYRSGSSIPGGLGDPPRDPNAWTGYTYPGGYPNQSGYQHTAQFGQPGWAQQTGQWGQQYPPYYQQPPRRRPFRSIMIAVGAVALSVLIGLSIGRIAWPTGAGQGVVSGGDQNFGSAPPPAASGNGGGTSTSINVGAIANKVDPGLVDVNTVLGYQQEEAAGTGIVLTPNGEILTNNHVVEGATSIKVTDIGNGKIYNATVLGYDRSHDIAVIQLQNASGLTTESLGDSSKVAVGDAVVGIGNAGGAGGTPSTAAGTVAALNQSITASDESSGASEQLTGLIQTNANIQAGDSGGSLVNSSGQVIGVDTAASSGYQFSGGFGQGQQNQQGQGSAGGNQGFAIPINQAISIAHEIIGGQASSTVHIGQTAFLGVSINDTNQNNGGFGSGGNGGGNGGFGNGSGSAGAGAAIESTIANGPAEQAGLQQGDVITALNGQNVASATALTNLMDTHHPGDKLTVTYEDVTGQQHTATVTPIAGPVG